TFTNNGTAKGDGLISVSNFVNNGTISPGLSPGKITFSGGLSPGSTSNLSFELGGATQGSQYDWLDKTSGGSVTLDGTLEVQLINGFTPQLLDDFTIVTTLSPILGAFDNVPSGGRLNTVGGDGSFLVTYTRSNNVTLSQFGLVVCIPPPLNMVSWWPGDGDAKDIQDSNSGTLQNGVTFISGEVGQAFHFNGVSQFVQTSN